MAGIARKYGGWAGLMVLILAITLSGCTSYTVPKDLSKMTPEEEAKVKDAAVNYIKTTYQKDYVVQEIEKDHVFGAYYNIDGYLQDGKKTPVFITGNPPDSFRDSYVSELWSSELEPHITEIANKTGDLIRMLNVSYGYKDDVERKYKGNIPSVFEVLKKGDKDLSLNMEFSIYQHGGQEKADIARFLNELKKMNFNDVTVTVFVYDDQLKSAPKSEDAGKYLLVRYNISGDIQTIDPNHLEPYKTVIKESK